MAHPSNDQDDNTLVLKIRAHDSHAFRIVYDRYWSKLFKAAQRVVEDQELAKDIVHDVFLSLWQNTSQTVISNLPSYLLQAVKYQTFNHLRSRNVSRKHLAQMEVVAASNETEKQVNLVILQERLEAYVEALPERQREVFRKSRYENKQIDLIAKEMDITARTAENHLHQALKSLRTSLK